MAFETEHNAGNWYPQVNAEGAAVIRLTELAIINRGARALRPALRDLHARLESAGPLQWYVLEPGEDWRPVTDADVWQTALPSGREMLIAGGFTQVRGKWTGPPPGEVVFAPWVWITRADLKSRHAYELIETFDADYGAETSDDRPEAGDSEFVASIPARPELRGGAGLLPFLLCTWCTPAKRDAELNAGMLASVSMLRSAAERLGLVLPAPAAAPAAASSVSHNADLGMLRVDPLLEIASAAAPVQQAPARKEFVRKARPAPAEILAERELMENAGQAAPVKKLAEKYKVSRDTIEKDCRAAIKARGAQSAASPFQQMSDVLVGGSKATAKSR